MLSWLTDDFGFVFLTKSIPKKTKPSKAKTTMIIERQPPKKLLIREFRPNVGFT